MLLTSMYLAIGNSLNALPSQLGQLTMWRALVQASLCCFADFLSACLKYTSDHTYRLCCGHAASHPRHSDQLQGPYRSFQHAEVKFTSLALAMCVMRL